MATPNQIHGDNIQEAAYSGLTSIVELLLNNGSDINAERGFYGTALQAAAYGGHKDVVELLIRRGAAVNAVGGFYGTALEAAAYGDYADIVEILLDAGADVNAVGGEHGTALRAAAYKGHESIVETLLQRGANVNAEVTELDALSRESGTALQAAAREGHQAVVQLLIDQGASINAISGFFGTALQAAASEGHEDVIQTLLDHGADINAVCGEFGTALQAAACEGHDGAVQLLIDNGADVEIEGGEFGTALEAAVEEGHEGVVQILLRNRAEVDSNAVQVALYQGHDAVARILLANGAPTSSHDGWLSNADSTCHGIGGTRALIHAETRPITPTREILGRYLSRRSQDIESASITEQRQSNGSGKDNSKQFDKKVVSMVQSTSLSNPVHAAQARGIPHSLQEAWRVIRKFSKFIGPGYIIAVAYVDPGNYSTGISAGAAYKYKLLFIILLSNVFAIFLQSLCIRLGTVTGLNLAENCREHLPRWLNYILYFLAESAIIATDIAEVIGSAIALNILLHIPLVAACALTILDVLVILLFYSPTGSMQRLRYFEYFVLLLVMGIMTCFILQLSYIDGIQVGEVFKGYLPTSAIVETNGLYLSCGILGATVMPHSLYLGSGVVQARLREFDIKEGHVPPRPSNYSSSTLNSKYRPTLSAIQSCMGYSIAELVIALFAFALFVNSSILITAGASLTDEDDHVNGSDLFDVHDLLAECIAPIAGTIFAVSLLISGTAAGIVATITGQMVSEGALNWTIAPWLRRLLTRSMSITPSIIIAASVGRQGLTAALNGTQITLSIILPFVSAPLIYFTCRNKFMTVATSDGGEVKMRNHWFVAVLAVVIWLIVVAMNVSLFILIVIGKAAE